MKKTMLMMALVFLVFSFPIQDTKACTNFLITKGASVDGSTMVSYAADSHVLYGELYHWPAATWEEGTMMDIYEWDTGKFLGKIKQAKETYNVVGNINEFQVAIGETTYGGRSELKNQEDAIMDYGSLIYLALQRSKTAREAMKTIATLMAEYGYASSGESFSISDPEEVWIMELIGKGPGEKGAVWVAKRVPDGYVCAHANQARITTFDYQKENNWDDPEATVFNAPDVISFAKEKGFYKGKDEDFSFSDVYAPVDFGGARFCEMRVYSFFKDVNKEIKKNKTYWEYAKGNIEHPKPHKEGEPLTKENFASNRMPLWIKPDKKVSVHDVMNFMRDHLEGTELDMRKDVGAGPFNRPYRWRPLTWKVGEETYCNERATATQQTGFSFVTQSRASLPDPIGGIIWFGVDDAASSVYVPMYCGITKAPETFAEGNGSMMQWTEKSAFWIFNQVTNLAYTRYDTIHKEISKVQQALEKKYITYRDVIDQAAKTLYNKDKELGIQFLTDYSSNTANELVYQWKDFYRYLFMKYKDGNIMKTKNGKILDNGNGVPKSPAQPGYGEEWYKLIIEKTGDQFKMKENPGH